MMSLKPVILETKRLFLHGISPADMTFIFENYSKEEIKRTLGHPTEDAYQQEAYKQKHGYTSYDRSFLLFLLKEKASGQIIGRCGFHNWYTVHQRAELGYHLSLENYKRQGLMTEAVGAVVNYGFHQMKLHRIEALVGSNNIPSLKIIKNLRFKQEGLLREHYFVDHNFEDSVLFSKLYEEYSEETANE